MSSVCPLCGSQVSLFSSSGKRVFYRCGSCDLIHLSPDQRLQPEAEAQRYRLHQNHADDLNYRAFLDKLLQPLIQKLQPGFHGLDYGCGPGPTVEKMMRERGFEINNYDPFFEPDRSVLDLAYDFIACTEAAEHFYHPLKEFDLLNRMLKPGGWLGVMTGLYTPSVSFSEWYYAKDPTHVSIYTSRTMSWIAARYGWKVFFPSENVILFQKTCLTGLLI